MHAASRALVLLVPEGLALGLLGCATSAPGFPAPSPGLGAITGRILFHGLAAQAGIPLSLELEAASQDVLLAQTAQTDANGAYDFNDLASGSYRVFFSSGGTVYNSTAINLVGYEHSPYIPVSTGSIQAPDMDLFWTPGAVPGPSATVSEGAANPMVFSFAPKTTGGPYQYQVLLANQAGSAFFVSPLAQAPTSGNVAIAWNFQGNTGPFQGQPLPTGQTVAYSIRFQDASPAAAPYSGSGYGGTSTVSFTVDP